MKTKVKREIKSRGIKSRGIKSRGIKSRKNVARKKASFKVKLSRGKNRGTKKGGGDKYLQFDYSKKNLSTIHPINVVKCIEREEGESEYECGEGGFARVYKIKLYIKKKKVPVLRELALRVVLNGISKTDVINEITGNKQHQVLQEKIIQEKRKKKSGGGSSDYNDYDLNNNLYIAELYGHGKITSTKSDSSTFIKLDYKNEIGDNPFYNERPFSIITLGITSLREVRFETDSGDIAYEININILKQIAIALKFIHTQGYVYFDLKPDNVIVIKKKPQTVRLIDFGMLKPVTDRASKIFNGGSVMFMSPEVNNNMTFLQSIDNPQKCDVFSFGIVIYDLLYKPNYYDDEDYVITLKYLKTDILDYTKLNTATFDEFPEECSVLKPLLQLCVKTDPSQRPTMNHIVDILSLSVEERTEKKIQEILGDLMKHLDVNRANL